MTNRGRINTFVIATFAEVGAASGRQDASRRPEYPFGRCPRFGHDSRKTCLRRIEELSMVSVESSEDFENLISIPGKFVQFDQRV